MSFFRKKNYMNEEISNIGIFERDDAIRSLEEKKQELDKEIESLMRSYARLTGQKKLKKKQNRRKRELYDLVRTNHFSK